MQEADRGRPAEDHTDLRALVGRAVRADRDAWEHLYRRRYSRLFAYARRRLTSDTAAEDAVSETMLRALDRVHTFTWQGAGFDAWLYGILRNVVLESYRRDGRTRSLGETVDLAAEGDDPLEGVVQRDRQTEVRTAFGRLSQDDQDLLELRVVAGLSAEGIAEITDRSPGAVRMAQSRALGRLRTHYEAVSHDDR
ncbi:MAG: sigma-70 family RNA polymerase sigma factor [Acidimicrobiales bacterium]